ncbi:MAG: hypothetical protein VW455_00520 [Nitrospinota bacterium]
MNETTQPSDSSNNSPNNDPVEEVGAEEETIFKPQNELPFPAEIDLNELFPEEDKDLNDLFPDEETKILLKKMQKNKKDLHTMTDRFLDEDWASDTMETASESAEAQSPAGNQSEETKD